MRLHFLIEEPLRAVSFFCNCRKAYVFAMIANFPSSILVALRLPLVRWVSDTGVRI